MRSLRLLSLLAAAATFPLAGHAISITQFNVSLSENFDTLANSTTSSVLPAGWELNETGSGANTTYSPGTGSSTTGNTYSFGATGSTERALGSLRTTSVSSAFGTVVTNDTAAPVTGLTIDYTGEQWRLGTTARVDRLDFAYSLDATSLTNGTWIELDALDFTAPTTTGVTGALDGNATENRTLVTASLNGLSLAPGTTLWLRWSDFDATSSDDGLGIDNFSVLAAGTDVSGGGGGAVSVPDSLSTGTVFSLVIAALLTLSFVRKRPTA